MNVSVSDYVKLNDRRTPNLNIKWIFKLMLNGDVERKNRRKVKADQRMADQSMESGMVKLIGQLDMLLLNDSNNNKLSPTEQFRQDLIQIKSQLEQSKTKELDVFTFSRLMSLTLNYHQSIDFVSMSKPAMCRLITALIESQAPMMQHQRRPFFDSLYQKKYFIDKEIVSHIFNSVLEASAPKAFRDLFDHINIIPNKLLFRYAERMMGKIAYLDLFYRLNPDDYEYKKWRDLTSYEKLYFVVFEFIFSKKLAHRLGLKGHIKLQWKSHPLSHLGIELDQKKSIIPLEGQYDGYGLVQIRETLLLFQLVYRGQHKEVLAATIDEMLSLNVSRHFQFKHKLKDKKDHIYLFGLDEHMTSGYHTKQGRYYEINMGYLSGYSAGIHIYHVSSEQRANLHGKLTSLQYNKTTHQFHQVPHQVGLKKFGYMKLPDQFSGNCTYESIKGLFLAILFDKLCSTLTNKQAAIAGLSIYRQFCEFDAKDAIFDYRLHSLSINQGLIANAYNTQPHFIASQVYEDSHFAYYNLKKKSGKTEVTHRHKEKQIKTLCFL